MVKYSFVSSMTAKNDNVIYSHSLAAVTSNCHKALIYMNRDKPS